MNKSENSTQPIKTIPSSTIQIVIILLLVIGSFLLGSLWQKVQFLEKGTALGAASGNQAAGGQAAAKKYKSLDEAMLALAKSAKLDGSKLVSCMNSGEKKSIVDADASLASSLDVRGTPGFFVNGRFLGGAYPYETFKELIEKEISGKTSNDIKDYSEFLQTAASDTPPSFIPVPKNIEIGNAAIRGDSAAKITIVEFSDFQCPYCAKASPTVEKILSDYKGKVRVVYKHLPLYIHIYAQKAAEASECARDQGKFWEFHDELFKQQADWTSI